MLDSPLLASRPTARVEAVFAKAPTVAVVIPVALGLLVRLAFVLGSDFPLHDGGLFYQMVQELQAAHLALPLHSAYNGANLPFAYPPLAFYLVAILNWITRIDLIQIFRFWPLVINTLTIFAFYPLARELLDSRFAAWAATLAFALLPGTYIWRTMGGGLTRSLGLLFCICALYSACVIFRTPTPRRALVYGLFAGLTVLSHPEAAYFMGYSSLVLLAARGRSRQGLAHFLLAVATAFVMSGPWLVAIVVRYGPGIFMLANQRGPALAGLTTALISPTAEALIPVWLFLACLGAIICLGMRRQQYLLVWFAAVALLQSRASDQVFEVPIALLAGIGFHWAWTMLDAGATALNVIGEQAARPRPRPADQRHSIWRTAGLLGLVIGYSTFSALGTSRDVLQGLSAEIRSAMQWTAAATPVSGKFLVLANQPYWRTDRVSEWFPVLAHRISVDTDQGYEWLGQYRDRNSAKTLAERCVDRDAECLEQWSRDTAYDFDYVFLAKLTKDEDSSAPDARALRNSLRSDARYEVLYDGPGATVFHRQQIDPL